MSLYTRNIWAARAHPRRGTALNACGRGVSSSILPSEDLAHEGRPKKHSNPLLHVQTHTGVRNMAHGLHIIRNIETKYGVIESFLFPRESGTNEYHPTFFFRFREPKSIRQLAKPYTHLDIPVLELEDKPNHEIGMDDVGYLVSPNSSEFFPTHAPEPTETGDPVESLPEDATSSSPNKPSTLKSRYAIRIAVSGLDEYPQPFFSHKTINAHERVRIERELAGWKGAYETLESASSSSQPQAHFKAQSIEELLQENFNVPQNTVVLPQIKHKKEPVLEGNSISEQPEQPEQPPQPTEYQLFRIHSRRDARSTSGDLLPDSDVGAGEITESGSPIRGAVADNTLATGSSTQSNPRVSAKRERQLEQMRRAAASQVRLVAEKRRIDEEAAKPSKAASEAETDDHLPTSNQGRSLWDKFLGR